MFDLLARMFHTGKLTEAQLNATVGLGWISQDQADAIVAGELGVLAPPEGSTP